MLAAAFVLALVAAPPPAAIATAVVVIANPAAEMPVEEQSFASVVARETSRLGGHWVMQARQAKKSTACNLDAFASLGFDLALCGQSPLSALVNRVLVFELALEQGQTTVRAAYFNPRRVSAMTRREQRLGAGETRQAAVQSLFADLFRHFGAVRFTGLEASFLFIDGHWIADAGGLGDMLLAPGRHTIEVRHGGDRLRLADLLVDEGERALVAVDADRIFLAAR
jgi:hypothetical protein